MKAAIKLHTLLDLRGNIPSFIHISDGKLHETNIPDHLLPLSVTYQIRLDAGNQLFLFEQMLGHH
jgi:hypothetical protein